MDGRLSFLSQQHQFFRALSARGNRLLCLDEFNNGKPGCWGPQVRIQGYAAYLADGGRFKTIALDFDAKKVGPEAAVADAECAMDLLAMAGIPAVMCASGSLGGRHVIFTPHQPGLSAERTRQLVDRLANLGLSSIDRSNLSNAASGAIRPPLAPRRLGYGRSRVLGPFGIALRVLEAGNPPEVVSRLIEELAGPADRRPSLKPPVGDRPVETRTYRSGSEALMALATRLANRRATEADLLAAIEQLQEDDPVRLHLARAGADDARATRRAWEKAVDLVAERPAVAATFVPDDEVIREWRSVDLERLPGIQGRVALVALAEAERHSRRLVGLPVRSTAEKAGVEKSAAGRALKALVELNLLEVASRERGGRGLRYRLNPVCMWSADARGTVGIYASLGGVGKPTVPVASTAVRLGDDITAEVWSVKGLGEAGRRIYRELALATAESGQVRTDDLALSVERHARTVARTLVRLKNRGLARRVSAGLWVAEVRDAVDLAFDLGVVGLNAARAARHAAERRRDAMRRIEYRLAQRGVEPVRQVAYDPANRWATLDEDFGCQAFSAADSGVSGGL